MGADARRKGCKRKRYLTSHFEPEADKAAVWSKGLDGKGAPLDTMYDPEVNIMFYGVEGMRPASKCSLSCGICVYRENGTTTSPGSSAWT